MVYMKLKNQKQNTPAFWNIFCQPRSSPHQWSSNGGGKLPMEGFLRWWTVVSK